MQFLEEVIAVQERSKMERGKVEFPLNYNTTIVLMSLNISTHCCGGEHMNLFFSSGAFHGNMDSRTVIFALEKYLTFSWTDLSGFLPTGIPIFV